MSATNKPLKTDLGGKPINQHYNPVADEHQPTEGANGAPNTRIKDGENEAFGARNDSPATSYNQTATLISLLKYMLQLLDSPWAKGDKGDKGDTGEALTPKGVVPDSASLPISGNTENDFWITSDDGHGWVWDGSQWIDVGQIQGDPGADGREVELQKSATHIQWRYVGEVGWVNLVTLSELKGDQGDPGNSAEFQVTATHIQWRLQGAPTWTDLIALSELEGEKGDAGDQVELRTDSGFIQWRLTGGTWANLIEIATLKGDQGDPGKSVELQKNATHVQWRLVGDPDWIDLIPLADLVGDQGDPGDEVSLQVSGGYIQWRLGAGGWTNLIAVADLKGDQGDPGLNAWTPVMAVESDGSRRVFKVVDWIGGGGTKPAVNVYIGASGYTANIAEAIDVRGMPGADGSGSGDMSKSTYDTNDDGKVNAAEVADSVDWSGVQNKPSTFTPSVHGHDDATTSAPGFMSASDKSKLDNVEANADVTDAQNVGTTIHGAAAKTTPVDADTVPLIDSAASNVLKKLSWTNIKATLKVYFDTMYNMTAFATISELLTGTNSTKAIAPDVAAEFARLTNSVITLRTRDGTSNAVSGSISDGLIRLDNNTLAFVTTIQLSGNDADSNFEYASIAGTVFHGGQLLIGRSGQVTLPYVVHGFAYDAGTNSFIIKVSASYTEASYTNLTSSESLVLTFLPRSSGVQRIIALTSNHTLDYANIDCLLTMSNASDRTITVPQNSSVAFPIGTHIDVCRLGAGSVTIVQGTGATLRAPSGLVLRAQYSAATLVKIDTNEWLVVGDLAS